MKKSISIAWPNSAVWCVEGWATKELHAKSITFVPVRDGAEALTFKQSGYVLNTIAEKLASTALGQRAFQNTTGLPSKSF
jgi:hypothetical protein